MDFETARRVLLVASIEEADKAGETVPHELRSKATDSAPDPGVAGRADAFTEGEVAFLAARADRILDGVDINRNAGRRGGVIAWVLIAVALLIGFFSKDLGPAGVVNILAFPLLGLMVWSLGVYLVAGLRRIAGKRSGLAVPAKFASKLGASQPSGPFFKVWLKVMAPAEGVRVAAWLHAGAAALAVGAVAAMYYQGLVRDYQASWASTFLSANQVHGLLSVALAPATWAPTLALPDAAGIEAIRAPGSERADVWIHRYALAVAVVVIIPRLVLALLAGLRARRLSGALPVRETAQAYFKTLLDEKRGVKSVVRVVPHRLELDSMERDVLRGRLHEHWGGSLWMDFIESVAYGDEEEFSERAEELVSSDHVAVVCGLATTPEDESQGRLLRAVSAASGRGDVLLVLEDGGFTERFGEGRVAERRGAWKKLASECGVEMLSGSP